eukprot:scaffold193_cov157-Skeletonema_menzelii.AAC.4
MKEREDQLTHMLRTEQGDFVGSLAALLREMKRCDDLHEFIVDDVDCRGMTAIAVSTLIGSRSQNPTRTRV